MRARLKRAAASRSTMPATARPPCTGRSGHLLHPTSQAGVNVCSCPPRDFLARLSHMGLTHMGPSHMGPSRMRASHMGVSRLGCSSPDLRDGHCRGADAASRTRGARRKAEAQTSRASAGTRRSRTDGARDAVRAARNEDDCPQSGPQHHLRTDRDRAEHDQPQHHRGAAARRERHGREDRAAVSGRHPGFGRERQFPRP